MSDPATLHELGSFVVQRINDDVQAAEAIGYDRGVSYAHWRRDVHAAIQRDIDERPWARAEVGNYLQKAARLYRDHPDYREWWH